MGGMNAIPLSRLTVARSGATATRVNAQGLIEVVPANTARLDYDPVGLACRGLLIEETRTNSLRNSACVGAGPVADGSLGVWPTNWTAATSPTSGVSCSLVGAGTQAGIPYVDLRFFGTATAAVGLEPMFERATTVAAAPGDVWTASCYLALVAGTGAGFSVFARLREGDDSSAFIQNQYSAAIPFAGNLARNAQTFTVQNAATTKINPGLRFAVASGATVDSTFRVGLPQLEAGAFATSPIITTATGVAVTRNADIVTLPLGPWFNPNAGTVLVEASTWVPINAATYSSQIVVQIDGGNSNNRYYLSGSRTTTNFTVGQTSAAVSSTVNMPTSTFVNWRAGTPTRAALAYGDGLLSGAAAGRLGGAIAWTPPSVPLTTLRFGTTFATFNLNGWLSRLDYYPRRLSDAELIALTA